MKTRVFSKNYLAAAITLLIVNAASAQWITLTAGLNKSSSQTVTLASNEVATVVHLSTVGYLAESRLEVVCGGVTNVYYVPDMIGGRVITGNSDGSNPFAHYNLPIIAGPAELRAHNPLGANRPVFCTLQITKPTSTFVPVNTVVVPNDNGAPVNIVLESSTDMIKWNAASPGTYGTSTTNRFFRVRAER